MKIYDVGRPFGLQTARVYKPWNPEVVTYSRIADVEDNIDSLDLISFGGGQDIHPSLYHHANVASHVGGPNLSYRDLFELQVWKLAISAKKPIVGICRGAQLSCALSGGYLIQNVYNHAGGEHVLNTIDGPVSMSSYHHQMMYPFDIPHTMIGWTQGIIGNNYYYDIKAASKIAKEKLKEKEPEIVFFPTTKALAIQGHPEFYSDPAEEPVRYSRHLINKYLFNGTLANV